MIHKRCSAIIAGVTGESLMRKVPLATIVGLASSTTHYNRGETARVHMCADCRSVGTTEFLPASSAAASLLATSSSRHDQLIQQIWS